MNELKDYFPEYIKQKSKIVRLENEIIRIREQYEREIAVLKTEIIKPKVVFRSKYVDQALSKENIFATRMDLLNRVLQVICEVGAMTPARILGRMRDGDTIMMRHLYCYVLRKQFNFTFKEIGKKMGRDHSTIIHACNAFEDWLLFNKSAKAMHQNVLENLNIKNNECK
jgi:chromosomal replication initiation ATPase DnaA